MRRWILTILLFLLLGVIVNVAVAWSLGVLLSFENAPEYSLSYGPFVDAEDMAGRASSLHRFGSWRVRALRYSGFGRWERLMRDRNMFDVIEPLGMHQVVIRAMQDDSSHRPIYFNARGWPMPALYCRFDTAREEVVGGIVLPWMARTDPSWTRRNFAVPLRPVWPGFLINTLFYAIILWLLIPGPFVLRRVIRIKRGRCPKCGYDLRGAPPEVGPGGGCPECGWNRPPEGTA